MLSHFISDERFSWRSESKYPLHSVGAIQRLLELSLEPDSKFPNNWVHTVHFDTPDLAAYQNCLDGDLRKIKIRARWYTDSGEWVPNTDYRMEVKVKEGARTGKFISTSQQTTPYSYEDVLCEHLWLDGLNMLPLALNGLIPVMYSRYQRHRFKDLISESRVSLDQHITGLCFNSRASPTSANESGYRVLEGGVIEVKSTSKYAQPYFLSAHSFMMGGYSKYAKLVNMFLG